ncbi:uncharacterized protein LOC132739958 isoform X2 [Ruditapes philippinarum]|uniref:uncharacterized protein LOC132739958 isoform X2 n=1 Tax=Ruditapes philippinarum TaxID=129788 RepID=UPI00295BB415|nr:uncharacterized protein LOC132739958 isoform X2 [Ruditapes philippinarum]
MKCLRYSSIIVIILQNLVTGIDFFFSKDKVLLGSKRTLTMRCDVTETDVNNIYLIEIRRIKSTALSGSDPNDWQTLALMELGRYESPTLTEDITAVAASKDYVAGGSWDSTTPANTYLTLSMSMEKMVCDDARYYRCELSYKSSTTSSVTLANRNSTFSAYVKPQVTSLITRKNGFIVEGMSPTNMATTDVGDELELTCTANIGSFSTTIIRWHRTSETSPSDEFIDYQPPQGTFDEGTATSDKHCGYTRVASIRYNVTTVDAYRDNNLAFECYVRVSGDPYGNSYTSENNPRFYTNVTITAKQDNGNTSSKIGTGVSSAALVGAVVSALVVGILLGLVLTKCYQRFIRTGDRTNYQPQQIEFQETEISNVALPANAYEQLQNRTNTEGRITYDSLNVSSSESPISPIEYEDMDHGSEIPHTYADVN